MAENMKQYTKKPMSNADLADRLIARKLIADKGQLLHALETVGYFRLTGYLYPFRKPGSEEYEDGTTFEKLWGIYTFDRKLRQVASDALARIEVAVRTMVVSHHTAAFPNDAFQYIEHASLPGLKLRRHTELLNWISRSMGNAKGDPDLTHLKREYGIEDYPPVWNVMEHSPFGVVTLFYEGLDAPIKQKVANAFYIQPNAFLGVLMALKSARNVCAHHSRFWNKHIQSRITLNLGVRRELDPLLECLRKQPDLDRYTSVFAILSICAHCIQYVHPQSDWKNRCKALVDSADETLLRGMGFPSDWKSLALWQ